MVRRTNRSKYLLTECDRSRANSSIAFPSVCSSGCLRASDEAIRVNTDQRKQRRVITLVTSLHWSSPKSRGPQQKTSKPSYSDGDDLCNVLVSFTMIKFDLVLGTRADRGKNSERKSPMAENLPLGLWRVRRDGEEARRIRKKIIYILQY